MCIRVDEVYLAFFVTQCVAQFFSFFNSLEGFFEVEICLLF